MRFITAKATKQSSWILGRGIFFLPFDIECMVKIIGVTLQFSHIQIRNLFIRTKYRGHDVGVDGFMIDVMRNRDSGIVPFIDFYGPCMSKKIKVWDDLKPFFEPKHFDVLRSIYENVKDIDLMTALLLEKRCKNWIGKIGACIMAEQFHRYKYGDRFFYSHPNNPHKFTSGLALHLICDIQLICPKNLYFQINYEI